MVIVIDFDGTLALGDFSCLENMKPNMNLVTLLKQMYLDGNYIKIVTARGCKSCTTIDERYDKYYNRITNWLAKHNIPYNELSFNKEYGDVYIDDRCHNIKHSIQYSKLDSEFTGNKVRRINNYVIKKIHSASDEIKWYAKAIELGLHTPEILTYDSDTISMSYIHGNECKNLDLIVNVLTRFKNTNATNNVNFNSYIDRIERHMSNNIEIKDSEKVLKLLKQINPVNTFNHGDFSTNNIIESDNKLYLIDPLYSDDIYQSYIIDIAKHLFSILYYSLDWVFYKQCYEYYISKLNIDTNELDILICTESIRVANRKKQFSDISNNLIDML